MNSEDRPLASSARIGVIWPGRPPTPEEEADVRAFLPDGVECRLAAPPPPSEPPRATLERVLYLAGSDEIEKAADSLVEFAPRAVAYACGTASYVNGLGGDLKIGERISGRLGVPATTTSTEMLAALRVLGVRRIAVLSPHIEPLNDRLRGFLSAAGIDVASIRGLGLDSNIEKTAPGEILSLARESDNARAEAIYIACTSLRTATVIDRIEAELGKPAITANQVTLWGLLSLAGTFRPRSDRGRLFTLERDQRARLPGPPMRAVGPRPDRRTVAPSIIHPA